MRLIDADALMERIKAIVKQITPIEESRDMFYHDSGINCAATDAWLEVKNAPTIEAEPVKHGRWVRDEEKDMKHCSWCGYRVYFTHNYCPNCGARMDVTDINVGNKTEG